jgi:MATE family multidrug resistance protein
LAPSRNDRPATQHNNKNPAAAPPRISKTGLPPGQQGNGRPMTQSDDSRNPPGQGNADNPFGAPDGIPELPDNAPLTPRYPHHRVRRHLGELFRLAVPVTLTRIGMLILAVVDTIVVGNYNSAGLAYLNIAQAPFISLMVTGFGLMMGMMVMTSHAIGRKDKREAGLVWRSTLPYAILVGLLFSVLAWESHWIFILSGQPAEITRHATTLSRILAIGMPFSLLYTACAFFLEGLARPIPGMVMMIVANVINLILDYGLVFGAFGLPEMGAAGAAWTSTVVRIFMALTMLGCVLWMRDHKDFGIREGFAGWWKASRHSRHLGYASGVSQGMETTAFATMQLFAGHLGVTAAASYGITMTVLSLMFMFALGLASATSVRVGIAYGRRDRHDMALAGWIGLLTTMIVMFALSLPLYAFPDLVARLFTKDEVVLASTAGVLIMMPIIFPTDGGQNAAISALRGAGDKWAPTALHIFSYLCVMIPAGYYFALVKQMGVAGLFWGIVAASLVAVSGLAIRFHVLSQRPISAFQR